jgi:outer membrane protein OmpA-like peptidoglycan-associated protein
MRAVLRNLAVAVTAAGTVAGLAACDDYTPPAEPQGATAFVLGARNNMPAVRLDGDARQALDRTVDRQAQMSVVVTDGSPGVDWSEWLVVTGGNEVAREESHRENQRLAERVVSTARAEDAESDLLAGLEEAAREVRGFDAGPWEIVVVDSGLSTTGELDFSQAGLLDAEPAEVVADLTQRDMLPDLSGIDVTVQGLGDTFLPQDKLTTAQRRNVVAIWTAVIEAASATSFTLEERPLQDPPLADLPLVEPVPLPERVTCLDETVVLSGAEVGFLPDSATLRDPQAARDAIAPVAEQLLAGHVTALVTGTTARWGTMEGQEQLSLDRAQAIVHVLVRDFGVDPATLTSEGRGSRFAGYVPDGGPEGPLDPAAAAQNRKVMIEAVTGTLSCTSGEAIR